MGAPAYTRLFATDALLPLAIGAALAAPSTHGTPASLLGAFVVAGAWDVVLRLIATGAVPTPGMQNVSWIKALAPYFAYHDGPAGVAYAAAAAGGAAAMAYGIIAWYRPSSLLWYMLWVFAVSVLVGLPMRAGPWFRKLQQTYYKDHPFITLWSDGLSGLIVAATMLAARSVA